MMKNQRLYEAILKSARKAARRDGALNGKDKASLDSDSPEPTLVSSLLLKMRKKGALQPADLTEIRVALREWAWGDHEFGKDLGKVTAEQLLEGEIKKDTPAKR